MAYTYRRTTKSGTYEYLCESHRDKETGKVITKQTLVGKVDPTTNEVILNSKNDECDTILDYGNFILLNKVIEDIKLLDVLKKAFPDNYLDIITCSMFMCENERALYKCKNYCESTVTLCNKILKSQYLSDLLKTITFDKRNTFFKNWLSIHNTNQYYALDITSISSYSDLIEYFEWGYNRDGESIPQINLMYMVGEDSNLPIYYEQFNGSINDVKTIESFIGRAKELNIKNIKLVMDKGFYSTSNIQTLLKNNSIFCIAIPFTTSFPKKIVDIVKDELITPKNYIYKHNCYGMNYLYENNNKKANIHIFYNEVLAANERQTFFEQVQKAENSMTILRDRYYKDCEEVKKEYNKKINKETNLNNKKELKIKLEQELKELKTILYKQVKKHEKCFDIIYENNTFTFSRSDIKIAEVIKYKGYMAVITNDMSLTTVEVLSTYRDKDVVEKKFDDIKNSIDSNRLGVQSKEALEGKLFIIFLSTIIISELRKIIKTKEKLNKYTVHGLLDEVKKLKVMNYKSGKKAINTISSKQEEIFNAYNISVEQIKNSISN